jgi:hypothetical protein
MESQFNAPGVAISFDVNQSAAIAQRKIALNDAAAKGYLVGAAHISFPGLAECSPMGPHIAGCRLPTARPA